MYLIHGTIATTGVSQKIVPAAVVPDRITPFQQFIYQNNGSFNMRLGDHGVSATRGILIYPSGGSVNLSPQLSYTGEISEFYVNGTAGDTFDILVME